MSTEQAPVPAEEQKTENGTSEVKENGSAEEATTENQAENESPKEMRAVVLTGFGGLKSVKILKKPEPTPGEGEVLIRVKAWWVFNANQIPLIQSNIQNIFRLFIPFFALNIWRTPLLNNCNYVSLIIFYGYFQQYSFWQLIQECLVSRRN